MKPGEIKVGSGMITLNPGRKTVTLRVENTADRPVQIGSHYHFYEANPALSFERDKTLGYHLNIASGTAVRFEPGQGREVELVEYSGSRTVYGFRGEVNGPIASSQGDKP